MNHRKPVDHHSGLWGSRALKGDNGSLPLMRHSKTYGPSGYGSASKYYTLNVIPAKPVFIEFPRVFGNSPGYVCVTCSTPGVTFNWTVGGGTIKSGQGSSCVMISPNCGNYDVYIRVSASNAVGTSSLATKYIPIDCSGGGTPL